jgi:hypothetical protein
LWRRESEQEKAMSERQVVLDEPVIDEQGEALRRATERAERAEAELAKLKSGAGKREHSEPLNEPGSQYPSKQPATPAPAGHATGNPSERGIDALREDSMMSYLLDSLEAGKDIGHYGRLVFTMVARHFLSDDEVIAELTKDPDFSEDQAVGMLRQVEGRDYNPPRRDRILEWQAEQEFPILPDANDPDCGNVYKSLRFPKELYDHIGHYQEAKAEANA